MPTTGAFATRSRAGVGKEREAGLVGFRSGGSRGGLRRTGGGRRRGEEEEPEKLNVKHRGGRGRAKGGRLVTVGSRGGRRLESWRGVKVDPKWQKVNVCTTS